MNTMVFVVEAIGTTAALKALRFHARTLGSHGDDGSCQKGRMLFYFTNRYAATATMLEG